MNIDYTLTESSNSDISFIDFNKFLNYQIFQKMNGDILDQQTKKFVKNIVKKYDLEYLKFNLKELKDIKNQVNNDFYKNFENIKEKMTKLKLIQKILNIDLNYYEKQIKNINQILKNENFKEDINNINEKILNNENITNDEMNKKNFYNQLVKQESYIKYVILSAENKLYSKNKTIIKNKIVEEMKTIENETKIYLKDENKDMKIDYNKVMKAWNENKLKKLFEKIDMEIQDDKNSMNLKYQLIESFKALTKKSYRDIKLIIKDNKFKEKIFGNISIEVINNKLNQLKKDIQQYQKIDKFLEETKTPIHVCPICHYESDKPIETLLHLSKHKNEDNLEMQRFYTYEDDNKKLRFKYSEKIIENRNKYFYEFKKKLLKSNTIENFTLVTLPIPINEINVQQIKYKIDEEQKLEEYKEHLFEKYKKYIKIFPTVADIIEKRIDMNELFGDTFSYSNKIIHYDVSRFILNNYFDDKDIYNLYDTNITYFDNNLKNNNPIDTLFKNIIHYNTFEPIENIKNIVNNFIKIIENINDLENMLFIDSSNKIYKKIDKKGQLSTQNIVADVEVSEYLDYKTLILLIPILQNRNFTLTIQNLIRSEDFEINDDDNNLYYPWKWVEKEDYNKMISKFSNIKKQDINIKEIENDTNDDYKRLYQLFKNIKKSELRKIKKEFELITDIFNSFLRTNRVAHDINNIDNDKDINGKFKEYIIGSYLKSSLNILNKIMKNNTDNTVNTKKEINKMFNVLSIFLNKKSLYLQKNKINFQRRIPQVVNNNSEEKNNKDDILNDYFESDEEYESNIEDNFEQDMDDELNFSENENEDNFFEEEDLF